MATSSFKVILFVDSILFEPILLDCQARFAMVNPKDFGGCSNSEMFAVISTSRGDIQTQVKDGIPSGDQFQFILDSRLSNKFLLMRNIGSASKVDSSKNTTTKNEIVELSDTSAEEWSPLKKILILIVQRKKCGSKVKILILTS